MDTIRWSTPTLLLYIALGLLGGACCYIARQRANKNGMERKLFSYEYLVWLGVWVFVAVFRSTTDIVIGSDTLNYITYFETALTSADRNDILYSLLNQVIRYFTDDYRVCFFVVYSFMTISLAMFINEFTTPHSSSIPLSILFYLYLRSFNTLRSSLALCVLLVAVVLLHRKKNAGAIMVAICSILVHKASVIYVAFFVFYFLFRRVNLSTFISIGIFLLAIVAGRVAQYVLLNGNFSFMQSDNGAYMGYITRTLNGGLLHFLQTYSITAFPQLLIFAVLIVFKKPIDGFIDAMPEKDRSRVQMVRMMCYFDAFLVPVAYTLSIWRANEYFMIARLVMWGELIPLAKAYIIPKFVPEKRERLVHIAVLAVFILWMIGRIEATWESSCLMPYELDLFY